jgi:chromosome segregation ATPase
MLQKVRSTKSAYQKELSKQLDDMRRAKEFVEGDLQRALKELSSTRASHLDVTKELDTSKRYESSQHTELVNQIHEMNLERTKLYHERSLHQQVVQKLQLQLDQLAKYTSDLKAQGSFHLPS